MQNGSKSGASNPKDEAMMQKALNALSAAPNATSKTSFIGTVPIRAQISHIKKWFVVNLEAYGESLRLLY